MTVGKLKTLLESIADNVEIEFVTITNYNQNIKFAETAEVDYIEAKIDVSPGTEDKVSAELIVATDGCVELYKDE
jgi:hypothetical protein